MTLPRLHLLARQAVARIDAGTDTPFDSIVKALVAATQAQVLPPVYDTLAPRYRDVCLALWGEPPMRAKDVHLVIGGKLSSIPETLGRLTRAGLVRRVRLGYYTMPDPRTVLALPHQTVASLLRDRRPSTAA